LNGTDTRCFGESHEIREYGPEKAYLESREVALILDVLLAEFVD
jgi:hypothetical protein